MELFKVYTAGELLERIPDLGKKRLLDVGSGYEMILQA